MNVTYAFLWARKFGLHPGSHNQILSHTLARAPSLDQSYLSPEIAMLVYGQLLQ